MGIPLSKAELREVADVSGVMDEDVLYFIDPRVKRECLRLILILDRLYLDTLYFNLHVWMAKLGLISRSVEAAQIVQLLGDERCVQHSH